MPAVEMYDFSGAVVRLTVVGEQPRSDGPGTAREFSLSINGEQRGTIGEDAGRRGTWMLRDSRYRILRNCQSGDDQGTTARRRLCELSVMFLAEGRLPLKLPKAALASRPAGPSHRASRQGPKAPSPIAADILDRVREGTKGRPTLTLGGRRN